MLSLVLKKDLLLICTLQNGGWRKYEKIILSIVMMRNDIIISLD